MKNSNYGLAPIAIILIVAGILALAGGGWWYLQNQQKAVAPAQNQQASQQNSAVSETDILNNLKSSWITVQNLISFRPSFHNQNQAKVWRGPLSVQFISAQNLLVSFEDDNNTHVAVFQFSNSQFLLREVIQNVTEFPFQDWQAIVKKYGDSTYPVSTYTKSLVRNGQMVNYDDLTKVPENVFLKNYWSISQPTSQNIFITNITAGQNLKLGENYMIKWEAQQQNNLLDIQIRLRQMDDTLLGSITNIYPITQKSAQWRVGDYFFGEYQLTTAPSGKYMLEIDVLSKDSQVLASSTTPLFNIVP